MSKTLGQLLAAKELLPKEKIREYTKQAKELGVTVSENDEPSFKMISLFSSALTKLLNFIERERKTNTQDNKRVLILLEDLAFFSTYCFEYMEKKLSVFDENLCVKIFYRILVMKKPSDVLNLIPCKLYFEGKLPLFQKIFLLSHVRFFSVKYRESLEADSLFQEILKSPYLKEFLFFYDIKKKYFIYDKESALKAEKFLSPYSNVFEALHALEFTINNYKEQLEKNSLLLKAGAQAKKQEKENFLHRLSQFLTTMRREIQSRALKGGEPLKFKHLSLCLNFAAQFFLSMHKTYSFRDSRLAFLQNFVDFRVINPVQLEIFDDKDPVKLMSISYSDVMEFAIDIEHIVLEISKIYPESHFLLRYREKKAEEVAWSPPKQFLTTCKSDLTSPVGMDAYILSGGVQIKTWEEHKRWILPKEHEIRQQLDALFKVRLTKSYKDLKEADFSIVEEQTNGLLTCTHPKLPGYFVDLAMDNYIGMNVPDKFKQAAERAEVLKTAISKLNGVENPFLLAKMWVYLLPSTPAPKWWLEGDRKILVLIRENLNQLPFKSNLKRWKGAIDSTLLENLFQLGFRTGLHLEISKLRFTKDDKIVISPYCLFNSSKMNMLTFAKHIDRGSFQFNTDLIERIYAKK